jgi:hypothetical protein
MGMAWFGLNLTQDMNQGRAVVNMGMNLEVSRLLKQGSAS